MKTALLAGSTGLIGGHLLTILQESNRYQRIIAITRQPIASPHKKVENIVLEWGELENFADRLQAEDIFCCLGTTIKKAKTREAFMKVDYEYPLHLGKVTHKFGARQYLLVSALGASPSSMVFYSRVKGQVEKAIADIGFESFHIFRPSLLTGDRKEHRTGEKVIQKIYKAADFLIPVKYKAVSALSVASAMLAKASLDSPGNYLYESNELLSY